MGDDKAIRGGPVRPATEIVRLWMRYGGYPCASFSRKPLPPPTVTIALATLCFQPFGSLVLSATARTTSLRACVQDRVPIAQIWYAPLSSTKLSIRVLPEVTRYSGRQGVPTV